MPEHTTVDVIDSFTGEWAFLSNFHLHPVEVDGVTYATAEHAYNALKTLDLVEQEHVRAQLTPGKAKRAGQKVTLRPNWDHGVRYDVMRAVVAAKFAVPDLRAALLSTGDALLIEGTGDAERAWHDNHWGQCNCARHRSWPGANHLGRILMAERARIRADGEHRWVRVAVTGHRPQHLTPRQRDFARSELARLAVKLRDEHDTTTAISGLALGADTWWADAALAAGLRLWAYAPFTVQAAKWPPGDQQHWRELMTAASRRLVLAEEYDVRLLHARNEFMVRDADVIVAVYDPAKTTGGTAAAMTHAAREGKTVVAVDVANLRTTLRRP